MLKPIDFKDIGPPRKLAVTSLYGKDYELHEATAADAARYENRKMEAAEVVDGKFVLRKLADLEPFLVSLLLGESEEVVRSWPSSVVEQLYDACLELSSGLVPKSSLESLKQQRDKLNEQIAKLEAAPDPKG